MGMLAQITLDPNSDEQRRTARRTLRLEVAGGGAATIRNLSHQGLLIETPSSLDVGDRVALELPLAGIAEARVIWVRAPFYGCEFARPISRAAISAALLNAPIEAPAVTLLGPLDTTWQLPDAEPVARQRQPSGGALASLAVLGSAISLLVVALASLPMS